MALAFKKAVRENVWVKVGLNGTSGSGKTYSALRVASGMLPLVGGEGIAFISTEKSRSLYYASDFNYDVLELDDYTPEDYINAIDAAINAGYKIVVVDSLSHGWQKLNDLHDKMPGNSFQNWGKLKPRWSKMMAKILAAPAHMFICSRAKTEWAMEEKNGKQTPTKVGLGVEGDKQQDFEYTISFTIQQGTHVASVDNGGKDNTGLYDGKYEILTEADGKKLYDWANAGQAPASNAMYDKESVTPSSAPAVDDELKTVKTQIIEKCKALGGTSNSELMATLKEYAANGNPNSIKELSVAQELLSKLEQM